MVLKSDVNYNLRITIHQASLEDTRTVSSILAKSFYNFPEFVGWVYPFLQFTINEDLRYRLRSRSPVYKCLVAKIPNPNRAKTTREDSFGSYLENAGQDVSATVSSKPSPQWNDDSTQPDSIIVGTAEITLRSASFWSNELQHPYISNLAVGEDYRRLGIGSQLLTKCEEIALDWGYPETRLHVLDKNDSAKQLYCHNGYQISQIEANWGNLWFDYSPRLLLRKMLKTN